MLRRQVLLDLLLVHVELLLLQQRHVVAEVPRLHRTLAARRMLQLRQLAHLLLAPLRQLRSQVCQEALHVLRVLRHLRLQLVGGEVGVAQQHGRLLTQFDRLFQQRQILGTAATVECGQNDSAGFLHVAMVHDGHHVGVLHRHDEILSIATETAHRRLRHALQILLLETQLSLFLGKILRKLVLLLNNRVHQLLVLFSLLLRQMRSLTTTHEPRSTLQPHRHQRVIDVLLDVRVVLLVATLTVLCRLSPYPIQTIKGGYGSVQIVLDQMRHVALTNRRHCIRRGITNLLHGGHIAQSEYRADYASKRK